MLNNVAIHSQNRLRLTMIHNYTHFVFQLEIKINKIKVKTKLYVIREVRKRCTEKLTK